MQFPTRLLFDKTDFALMMKGPDWWRAPQGSSHRTVAQDKRRAAKARAIRRAKKHRQA